MTIDRSIDRGASVSLCRNEQQIRIVAFPRPVARQKCRHQSGWCNNAPPRTRASSRLARVVARSALLRARGHRSVSLGNCENWHFPRDFHTERAPSTRIARASSTRGVRTRASSRAGTNVFIRKDSVFGLFSHIFVDTSDRTNERASFAAVDPDRFQSSKRKMI